MQRDPRKPDIRMLLGFPLLLFSLSFSYLLFIVCARLFLVLLWGYSWLCAMSGTSVLVCTEQVPLYYLSNPCMLDIYLILNSRLNFHMFSLWKEQGDQRPLSFVLQVTHFTYNSPDK